MLEPILFDFTDLRAGTVWKDNGTFLTITECVITDIDRPHAYGSGETAQLQRVIADIKFDPADDSESAVVTHLAPLELVHLSGYAWRVSAIHCQDRRTLSVRLVRQPEDDQEPVMTVQSFDRWPAVTQEQFDDAGDMPQRTAAMLAEARVALDAD